MRLKQIAFLILASLSVANCIAGGADGRVRVENIAFSTDVDYIAVVGPISLDQARGVLPYGQPCSRIVVIGTFGPLIGSSSFISRFSPFPDPPPPPEVSRTAYIEALVFLRKAASSHATIGLGRMGTGFEPLDPKQPCIVRSRALVLDLRNNAVISYYHHL